MPDAWPATLPQCLPLDNQQEGSANNLIRSQPDTGPAQVRRRSTSAPRPWSGMVVVTRSQLAILRNFVEVTLDQGALPFTLPATSEAGTWLVRFADGGLPKWRRVGPKYSVTMQLEILP